VKKGEGSGTAWKLWTLRFEKGKKVTETISKRVIVNFAQDSGLGEKAEKIGNSGKKQSLRACKVEFLGKMVLNFKGLGLEIVQKPFQKIRTGGGKRDEL